MDFSDLSHQCNIFLLVTFEYFLMLLSHDNILNYIDLKVLRHLIFRNQLLRPLKKYNRHQSGFYGTFPYTKCLINEKGKKCPPYPPSDSDSSRWAWLQCSTFAAFEIIGRYIYLYISNFASMPFNFLLYLCMYMPVAVRMHIMGEQFIKCSNGKQLSAHNP